MLTVRQKLLVKRFLPLAHQLALRRYRCVNGVQDLDDLRSDAMIALVRAATLYRPDGGASFLTYAHISIWRRFMVDRPNDGRRRAITHERLEYLDGNPRELIDMRAPDPSDVHDPDPRLVRALGLITSREREIVQRIVVEGETVRSVGRALNISPTRVNQVRDLALRRLRAHMGDPQPLYALRRQLACAEAKRNRRAS